MPISSDFFKNSLNHMPISSDFFKNSLNHMTISSNLFKNNLKGLPLAKYGAKIETQTAAEKEQHKIFLKSGFNSFTIKIAFVYTTLSYSDTLFYNDAILSCYDDILYLYQNMTNSFYSLSNFNFESRPMHPLIKDTYDSWVALQNNNFTVVRTAINTHVSTLSFYSFSPLSFATSLSQFHYNLAMTHSTLKFITFFLGSLVLVIGVNIHNIIEMIVKLINVFINFVHYLIKSCSRYYDPVRDCIPDKQNYAETDRSNNSYRAANTVNNNKTTSANNGSNGDGDDEKNPDRRFNPEILNIPNLGPVIEILRIFEYILGRILDLRRQDGYTAQQSD
jgi:hypothetical protein